MKLKFPFNFKPGHKKWMIMKVDRLFFESQSDRYFIILRAAGKHNDQTFFFNIGSVFEESVFSGMFSRNDATKRIFDQIGAKVVKIRILKKMNSADSAEGVIKIGWYRKTVKLSTMEAVKIATENELPVEIPWDMARADKFDLIDKADAFHKAQNNVFSSKYIERDDQFTTEVIM